ncbi:MAG: alpha/beta hydrolase [Marinomonas sp.]
MTLWIIGIVAVLVVGGFLALQYAIARNGPAVLDTADRITGGTRGVELAASAQFGGAAAQKIRVYKGAADEKAQPVIIFAHGGSWRNGNPDDYGFIARALVPEGFVVVLAGYRMHPDAVYPAMLEDTASAVAWTKANIAQYGGDPERIILTGHSAGAYNVVMTALDQQWLAREGLSGDDIIGVAGLAGPYDFFPFDSESTIDSFGPAKEPAATQPINAVRGDAPPMLFVHGEKDTLVYPRNSRVLAKAITEAGGDARAEFFPEMAHNEPLMALASPYRRDAKVLNLIAEFARETASQAAQQPAEALAQQTSVPVQGE